ncbi:MAG: hypothetical protein R2759_09890 [Bacteroidales bacterium]
MPDNFKSCNWGLQFGASRFPVFLTVDVRYELGLSNIYNKPDDAADSDLGSLKSNVFFVEVAGNSCKRYLINRGSAGFMAGTFFNFSTL